MTIQKHLVLKEHVTELFLYCVFWSTQTIKPCPLGNSVESDWIIYITVIFAQLCLCLYVSIFYTFPQKNNNKPNDEIMEVVVELPSVNTVIVQLLRNCY